MCNHMLTNTSMWDMRRSVDPAVFSDKRVVMQFKYPDATPGARDWWLVSDGGEIDLCLHDVGFKVDILIRCSLSVMTEIWTCRRLFNDAVRCGDVDVKGDAALANQLQAWLRASGLATLGERSKSHDVGVTSD